MIFSKKKATPEDKRRADEHKFHRERELSQHVHCGCRACSEREYQQRWLGARDLYEDWWR